MSDLPFPPIPKDPRFINRTGKTFGNLLILGYAGKKGKEPTWHARCTCGQATVAFGNNLQKGHTTSCGCQSSRKTIGARVKTHGFSNTVEYKIYKDAKKRCCNPKASHYSDYGGRGIKFLFVSFVEFREVVGPRPSADHSLDRIDVNSHYMPGNCRWATKNVQMNNMRSNQRITFRGETKNLTEWAGGDPRKVSALSARLCRGWSIEEALTRPFRKSCLHASQ